MAYVYSGEGRFRFDPVTYIFQELVGDKWMTSRIRPETLTRKEKKEQRGKAEIMAAARKAGR